MQYKDSLSADGNENICKRNIDKVPNIRTLLNIRLHARSVTAHINAVHK